MKSSHSWVRWILAFFLAGILAVVAMVGYSAWRLYGPLGRAVEDTVLYIPPGAGMARILNDVRESGWDINPRITSLYARAQGWDTKVPGGEIRLENCCANAVELLEKIIEGKPVLHPWTLVEGWSFPQTMRSLRSHRKVIAKLRGRNACEIAGEIQAGFCLEGLLLPDTYLFAAGTDDMTLIKQARDRQNQVLNTLWPKRAADLPYESFYDALILASIVEREARVGSERGQIAGVYINRLRRGMLLEADPTVLYGRTSGEGPLLLSELRDTSNPYNTYKHPGLPPTPIGMPSSAAIEAALHPEDTEYLFFVAAEDGTGRHLFSKTLRAHRAKVRAVRAARRVRNAGSEN